MGFLYSPDSPKRLRMQLCNLYQLNISDCEMHSPFYAHLRLYAAYEKWWNLDRKRKSIWISTVHYMQ